MCDRIRLSWLVAWVLVLGCFSVQGAGAGTWIAYPYQDHFDFSGRKLQDWWAVLHMDDMEPYPSAQRVEDFLQSEPEIKAHLPLDKASPKEMAAVLQDAWRFYHEGKFQKAYELGCSLSPLGNYVAGRALAVHNFYLAPVTQRRKRFKEQLDKIEQDLKALEREKGGYIGYPNFYFGLAYVAGRYSQASSILISVKDGLAGEIKRLLEQTLEWVPNHQAAWISKGSFQAELISKVGGLIARLTYGATKKRAIAAYEKALELNQGSLIARVEYAHGLLLLDREKNMAKAKAMLQETLTLPVLDAFGRLVQERAKRMLVQLQEQGADK